MSNISLTWQQLYSWYNELPTVRRIRYFDLEDSYAVLVLDDIVTAQCVIQKTDPKSSEQIDFETNYISKTTQPKISEVVNQMEKNDKSLRTFVVFCQTNSLGEAEACVPIPSNGRAIAYGDVEFEVRHFGDYIKILEITDLDRYIAWQAALSQDPLATVPLPDEVVQVALGLPQYPVLDHYDERSFPSPMPENARGDIRGGIGMTFQFGSTETQPVGGYGNVPGNFYLRVVCQKASGHFDAGQKCQLSIDWAEPI